MKKIDLKSLVNKKVIGILIDRNNIDIIEGLLIKDGSSYSITDIYKNITQCFSTKSILIIHGNKIIFKE